MWMMQTDAWMTSLWTTLRPKALSALHSGRYILAFLVVALSVADLLLTQTILSMVDDEFNVQSSEANVLMAPIVMTWWAWPVRVGIPLIAIVHDLRRQSYSLMVYVCILYAAVVAWNTHMYFLVSEAVR